MDLRIQQLWVYPVKSLRGIPVSEWSATRQGLAFDRHWMLVKPNGRFVSQRQLPRMALIDTAFVNHSLQLSADGHGSITLPLQTDDCEDPFSASVWRDHCEVQSSSATASAWLNDFLLPPQPLRLVHMRAGFLRQHIDATRFGATTHTRFADAAPYLIANLASLLRLNEQLQQTGHDCVDMRRFRPNLVVSDWSPFAEHDCQSLLHMASGRRLRLCDPCERCVVTTIDPDRGVIAANNEPYNTLRRLNPMPGNTKAAAFAANATFECDTPATLCVGDRLLANSAT